MAELDAEAVKLVSLKHELAKVAEDPDEFTLHASEIRPLLAALEDRDRLRAEVAEWRELAEAWVDYPQLPSSLEDEFRAALEHRDGSIR